MDEVAIGAGKLTRLQGTLVRTVCQELLLPVLWYVQIQEIKGGASMHSVALAVHIAAGTICLVTGLVALAVGKRRGLHTAVGEVYHGSYVFVFLSAIVLSLLNWADLAHLFFIAIFSYGLAVWGYMERKRQRPGWLARHISGMAGSFIGVTTAVLVTNGPRLPGMQDVPELVFWLAPTVIGSPLVALTVERWVSGKARGSAVRRPHSDQ